jgi:hypothetical protein
MYDLVSFAGAEAPAKLTKSYEDKAHRAYLVNLQHIKAVIQ